MSVLGSFWGLIGHGPKWRKLALLVLWLRCWWCPLEMGEVITGPSWWWWWWTSVFSMTVWVFTHMLPDRILSPCAHQSMAGNSIHAWQHQSENHLLATHVLCPRRNLEVSAVVTPCASWRAISFFLISFRTRSRCLSVPTGGAVLESFSGWTQGTQKRLEFRGSILRLCLAAENKDSLIVC